MVLSLRRTAHEILSAVLVATHIFIAWKALAYVTNSPTPIAVVTSESMEPGFQLGDVVFLWNRQKIIEVGDIALVSFETRKLPMVHRVLQSYHLPSRPDENGSSASVVQYIRTKGDNVVVDDAQLYPNEEGLASRDNVIGLVRGVVPYLGLPFWILVATLIYG